MNVWNFVKCEHVLKNFFSDYDFYYEIIHVFTYQRNSLYVFKKPTTPHETVLNKD